MLICAPPSTADLYRADAVSSCNSHTKPTKMKRCLLSKATTVLGLAVLTASLLSGCGGGGGSSQSSTASGTQSYAVAGTLTSLAGGTSIVLQDNGGDDLTLTSNGTFIFAQNIQAGGTYAVTVLTQPTKQTCTVTNGSGSASANISNVAVNCVENPEYAYVANSGSSTVSQYTIGAGGALTPMATATVAAGTEPNSVVVAQP